MSWHSQVFVSDRSSAFGRSVKMDVSFRAQKKIGWWCSFCALEPKDVYVFRSENVGMGVLCCATWASSAVETVNLLYEVAWYNMSI
jgi:hypothetical protein